MAQDLFAAYVSGAAGQFYPQHFADPTARRLAVRRAARPIDAVVAATLERQNAPLASSPARDAHLAALREGAAAVVTGQQVGLFLGPLFTLYKAASAIRVAQALTGDCDRPVVPVFWLQTEDHDLAEIAEYNVAAAAAWRTLRHPAAAGARVSIAHCILGDQVRQCADELEAAIAHLPHAAAHMALLRRHYRPGAGWARAFAGVLAELFAAEGLVIIDPRDPALAEVSAPIHRRALLEAEPIAAALSRRGEALIAAGHAPAVHVRCGAPLSFVHPHGAAASRYRLDASAHGFAEVGGTGTHARDALLALLQNDPACFSTSALLRPILQDFLLPTAAYVGGPGEIAYFAQLAPLYAAYDIAMPLLVPRARFRIVEPRTRRLLDELGLTAADAQRSEDDLLALTQGADASTAAAALARRLLAPFDTALAAARGELLECGAGLDGAVAKTRSSVDHAVAKLAAKYEKALRHRAQHTVDAVRELRSRLSPNGAPQERVLGMSSFAARWGDRALIERVLAAIVPFDAAVRELEWTDATTAAAPMETKS